LTTAKVLTIVTNIDSEDDTERLVPTQSKIDSVMKKVNGAAFRCRLVGSV
jgi:hypothetical protein